MKITLRELREVIGQEVRKLIREGERGEQMNMFGSDSDKLGRYGEPKAHRGAVPYDPPRGFELETQVTSGGQYITNKKPGTHGDYHRSPYQTAVNKTTGERVKYNETSKAWEPIQSSTAKWNGIEDKGHNTRHALGGRETARDWGYHGN
jgi:hypothetical protein